MSTTAKLEAAAAIGHLAGEIREALATSTGYSEGRLERITEEVLRQVDRASSEERDPMEAAMVRELTANPLQYHHALDVCDGSETLCAHHMLEHMRRLLEIGRPWPMVKAMAHFDAFAAMVTDR